MTDEIKKMEDLQVPKGRIDLVGCGRLGLRIAINLMQVHRGGPNKPDAGSQRRSENNSRI